MLSGYGKLCMISELLVYLPTIYLTGSSNGEYLINTSFNNGFEEISETVFKFSI